MDRNSKNEKQCINKSVMMRTLMSGCGTDEEGSCFSKKKDGWSVSKDTNEISVAHKIRWHTGQLTKPTEIPFSMRTCIVCVYKCICGFIGMVPDPVEYVHMCSVCIYMYIAVYRDGSRFH